MSNRSSVWPGTTGERLISSLPTRSRRTSPRYSRCGCTGRPRVPLSLPRHPRLSTDRFPRPGAQAASEAARPARSRRGLASPQCLHASTRSRLVGHDLRRRPSQPRGQWADQVAPARRLEEDRRCVESAHGGGGMTIRGVAFVAVLALSLLAAPLVAGAQQAGKVPRIGFLSLTSPSDRPLLLAAFRQELRELGWVEGQNIVIDYRYEEGRVDRLRDLAAELVRLKLDLIVSW